MAIVTVTVRTPMDRTQFYRDAEAASRLMSDGIALRYLASLCRAKAMDEAMWDTGSAAFRDYWVDSLMRELWQECVTRGYHRTKIGSIRFTVNVVN